MEYILPVSKDGEIVIPDEVRRMFNIKSRVLLKVEDGEIKIIPFVDLKEAFGIDGEKMYEVAKELLKEKKRELNLEE